MNGGRRGGGWEGRREGGKRNDASELARQSQTKAYGSAPADLPGAPRIILEKPLHWLGFNCHFILPLFSFVLVKT